MGILMVNSGQNSASNTPELKAVVVNGENLWGGCLVLTLGHQEYVWGAGK